MCKDLQAVVAGLGFMFTADSVHFRQQGKFVQACRIHDASRIHSVASRVCVHLPGRTSRGLKKLFTFPTKGSGLLLMGAVSEHASST